MYATINFKTKKDLKAAVAYMPLVSEHLLEMAQNLSRDHTILLLIHGMQKS